MWKELSLDQPLRSSLRALDDPKYVNTLKIGQNFLNSISQLIKQLVGTTMRCGPQMPLRSYCYHIKLV